MKRGESKPIYLTDLSVCEPKSALSPEAGKGCWSVWEYETQDHKGTQLKGKLLYANTQVEPPPVTLRLGVSGWHAVYLGFYYADDPNGHTVRLKLTGDESFDRVRAETTSPKDGNYSEQNINFSLLAETLWRAVDLTDKDLTISRPNPKGSAGKEGCSSLAYVKLVPLSKEDLDRLQSLAPTEETKRLIAVTDGASAGAWWPQSKEDLWEDIDPLAGTDVDIVLCTMARYDITYYPSKVGEMRSVKRGIYHQGYAMQAGVLAEMRRKGLDMLRVYIDRAHEHGLKFYATNRPAGPHPPPNHLTGEGPFFRKHPELRCITQEGQAIPHLSFAFPKVRKRLIRVLREQAEAGADGVSIMFNRSHPWVLFEAWEKFRGKNRVDRAKVNPDDEAWCRHKAGYLTKLMRELRKEMDEVGETQGRRIGIGHMVMGTVRTRLYFGIDVETWMREGLVDFLIIHPTNYHELPFPDEDQSVERVLEELKPAARTAGVKLYSDVYPRRMPGYVYLKRAQELYGAGADGLAYWDVESRIYRKSEWFTSSRLGHVQMLNDWPLDLRDHFDRIPLKSVAGMVTDRRYSGHTNG